MATAQRVAHQGELAPHVISFTLKGINRGTSATDRAHDYILTIPKTIDLLRLILVKGERTSSMTYLICYRLAELCATGLAWLYVFLWAGALCPRWAVMAQLKALEQAEYIATENERAEHGIDGFEGCA